MPPYRLVTEDRRLRFWHIPMGPLLWKDNYTLYFPGNPESAVVPDYYQSDLKEPSQSSTEQLTTGQQHGGEAGQIEKNQKDNIDPATAADAETDRKRQGELAALDKYAWAHPKRILLTLKFLFTYGVTRDVIHHQSRGLEEVHKRAPVFDNKVEHLWTTAQVCSAMVRTLFIFSYPYCWIIY